MIKCEVCARENQDNSQYCDECGSRLENVRRKSTVQIETPKFQTLLSDPSFFQSAGVTSMAIPPPNENLSKRENSIEENQASGATGASAKLVVERGNQVGTEFRLTANESFIGRWDPDNGIFPEIDLDKHDSDAKVSRRHARITCNEGKFSIEDLGSTNGTFINRGRRLIPGIAQSIKDGDEIIVGKTFLRFYVKS